MTIFAAVDRRRWSASPCLPPVTSTCCAPGVGAGGGAGGAGTSCAAALSARVKNNNAQTGVKPRRKEAANITRLILAAPVNPRAGPVSRGCRKLRLRLALAQVEAELTRLVHDAQHGRCRGEGAHGSRGAARQHGREAHRRFCAGCTSRSQRLTRGLVHHGSWIHRALCSEAAARRAHSDSAAPEGSCAAPPRDKRINDDAPP